MQIRDDRRNVYVRVWLCVCVSHATVIIKPVEPSILR